jgi:putative ABC transport system permease protein
MFSREFGRDIPLTQEKFDKESGPFDMNILINELAVKQFGFGEDPNDALGKSIQLNWGKRVNATIVGVLANSHYSSVREAIKPELYMLGSAGALYLAVHFTGSLIDAEKQLKEYWQENITDMDYLSSYVGATVARQFSRERKMSAMLALASGLAVIIACMGLFGLASFTAERRTKEIGLRKVMGATVSDIVKLLIWQFSKPIIIASILASMLSFMVMALWLEQFPYRIDIWVIAPIALVASILAIAIAWLTVGGNAIKVARSQPIKALRYE